MNAADAYGTGGTPGLGVIRRLEHHLNALPNRVQDLRATHDGYPDKIARLTDTAGQDFPHHDELARIRARISHLDAQLTDRTPAADAAPARRPEWLTRLDPDGTTLVWGPELQQVITDGRTTYDQLVVGDIITPPDKTAGPHRITRIHGYGTRDYHLQPINGADRDNGRDVRISKKSNTGVTLIARPRSAFSPTPDPGAAGITEVPLVPARAGGDNRGCTDHRFLRPTQRTSRWKRNPRNAHAMSTGPRKLDAAGMSLSPTRCAVRS